MLQNWDKYEEFLHIAQNSKGTAETKYAAYQESVQAADKRFQATWEAFLSGTEFSELLILLDEIKTSLVKFAEVAIKYGPTAIAALSNLAMLLRGRSVLGNTIDNWAARGALAGSGRDIVGRMLIGQTRWDANPKHSENTEENLLAKERLALAQQATEAEEQKTQLSEAGAQAEKNKAAQAKEGERHEEGSTAQDTNQEALEQKQTAEDLRQS